MKKLKSFSFLLLSLLLSACSFVTLTAEGEKVRVLSSDEVTKCEHVGQTTSKTTSSVVVKRHDNAVSDELASLARNSAVELGGDTVVPDGDMKEGKQTFQVYRCVPK